MAYELSVLVPGIRTENWQDLYKSIGKSFSGTWEMVIISPYKMPINLEKYKENITIIEDWGTPIKCQQRGLINAQGKWITWAADDGIFLPGALDIGFEKLKSLNFDIWALIMGKYNEGKENPVMAGNDYYVLSNHNASRSKWIPKEYLMLNVGIVSKMILIDIGGWDCQFEVCPMAYNDLAIRLQNYGVKFYIQDEMMFKCSHMPGHEGDHGPIHDGQVDHDQPLFQDIYSLPESKERTIIDLDNWKNVPARWERRFGK